MRCVVLPANLFLLPLLASAAGLTGEWSLHTIRFGEDYQAARVTLQSDGPTLTGTLNELKLSGTTAANHLSLTSTRPNGKPGPAFEGEVKGEELTGTGKGGGDTFNWTAHRIPAPAASPRTHNFEPTKFQRQFSGTIEPVLHVSPGDTIKTSTVDAGGKDAKGTSRSLGGNPETGPFFIDGAMPGDTLAVKIQSLRLNRDSAESGDRITAAALTPNYHRDAKFDDNFDSRWKLDREANLGTLAKPTDRLKNFKVKLQPMLGCIGVAPPANQAYRSGWLGSWGGNMDYSGIREGVTVYLPVYKEGAFLFVGDGHALEGDGELNGDALETSMDITFTINIEKGKSTQAPRFENDDYLMASGIGGSLQDALQQSTTELARWLERDYKLTANESNIVLGTSIHYDIAEVVDPQVHIVAKINKAVLATLKQ